MGRQAAVPCCCCWLWECVSLVGEPWSARPRRLEMEGSEHLLFSSMGGDGGGWGT
jgi:hypothetical protein